MEDDLAMLVQKLLSRDGQSRNFGEQRILTWAADHLKSGETEKCVQLLHDIAQKDVKYSWIESLADEARINVLNQMSSL